MAESSRIKWLAAPERQPVPRWRRRLSLLALLTLIGLIFSYNQLTSPNRLRRYAQLWLEEFSGGEARVGSVQFEPFTGLTLSGVTVAVPRSANFDTGDDSFEARTIFRSATLFLRLQPLSLLTGRLGVPEIVAVDPELILVRRGTDLLGNWQCMFRNRSEAAGGGSQQLPTIRLRNARLVQYQLGAHGRSGGAAQVVWADAQPVRNEPQVYDLKLGKVITAAEGGPLHGETARLWIDMATRAVRGSLPTMNIDELLFTAPPQVIRWLNLLAVRGQIRPDDISYEGNGSGAVTLSLRDASFAVPIDSAEEGLPPGERYLRFSGIAGKFTFDHGNVSLDLQGRFREQPLTLKGSMWLANGALGGGLDAVGFELALTAQGVPLPRQDADTAPAEIRFVNRWKHLRNFVRDFDGRGPVNLALRLRKAAGAGSGVQFLGGTMTLRGNSGRYFKFPYELEQMTGVVRFLPDGTETLDLTGRHGPGTVSITGSEGGYKSQAGDLRIRGRNIVLDEPLLNCLDEEDRALCRRFNVEATMDIDVHLTRRDAPPGTPDNPWNSVIDVVFLDGTVLYDGFPYPLERLRGKMHIAAGSFSFDNLSARRGETVVRASGSASGSGFGLTGLALQIEAERVPCDDALAAALPPEVRGRYQQLAPSGHFDLRGSITNRTDLPETQYQFRTALQDVSLTTPFSPARLHDVQADLEIRPDELLIRSSRCRFGSSLIQVDGRLAIRPQEPDFNLHISSDCLALDETLRQALPETWRSRWKDFQPGGFARIDVTCERRVAAQPPPAQPDSLATPGRRAPASQPAPVFVATLEPLDATATYAGLPLRLEAVNGKIVVTPAGVRIEQLSARHQETTLQLSGQVLPTASGSHAELSLSAAGLKLDDDLRKAMPWRIRRQWNEVKPRGEMDLKFERLIANSRHGGETNWEFQGSAALRGVGMSVGPELADATGTIEASGQVGADLAIDGRIALTRVVVDGRTLTGATADLKRPPGSRILRIDDIFAHLYGGTVVGHSQLDHTTDIPKYSFALTIRDVQLDGFLNAALKPGKAPLKAKGLLDANLSLSGQAGRPESRRGGGSIAIREAQVFKIPLMFAFLQVINLTVDDNAFHDAAATFAMDGPDLVLSEIDLRGNALSMVGAGRVETPTDRLDLTFLVGGPVRLPRMALLSDLMEQIARELLEVHVEGTLGQPQFRVEMVRSIRRTLEEISNTRRPRR